MQFISELHGYPFNTLPRIARVPMPVQSDCIARGILFCFDVCVSDVIARGILFYFDVCVRERKASGFMTYCFDVSLNHHLVLA